MKILQLDLLAFGPFTNASLDLSDGNEGLHIVYGPNEAGKSSSLRALRQFFYGIPAQTADSFIHPYKNMRIGAKLRHSDGSILEVIRRKANTNTLRGPDDTAVVPPEKLQSFLGSIDQKLFETMFGIDHPTLVAGGKEIVKGGGQFGEILFAASAGLSGLRKAQEGLAKKMGDLFLPRGSNPRINQLVADYQQVRKEFKERQLSADEWSRHHRAYHDAEQRKQSLQTEMEERTRELSRLRRIAQGLKPIAARKQLLDEMEKLKDVPPLAENFSETRRQAQTEMQIAQRAAEEAKRLAAEVEARLKGMRIPEGLLAQAVRIEEIYVKLGAHRKHLEDLPQRQLQMRTTEHEAKEILRSLGFDASLSEVEKLRLTREEISRIQNLGNEYQGLRADRENARKNVDLLARRIEDARRKLTDDIPADPAQLRSEFRQAMKLGEPEEELFEKEQSLTHMQHQVTIDLERLPYWKGTLNALEKLSIPGDETIQELTDQAREQNQRLAALDQRRAEEERKLANLEETIRRLELQQDVPTEDDLQHARQRRDRGWALVREAWLEGDKSLEASTFIQEMAPGRHLAEAYEHAVSRADDTVDRLRREADRVAEKANLIAQADGHRRQLRDLENKRLDAQRLLEESRLSWLTLLRSRGLPELRLSEARKWFQDQAAILKQSAALRELGRESELLRKTIASHRQRLAKALQALGETGPRAEESLATLLERCQEVVKQREAARTGREKNQETLESLERDLVMAQARSREAEQELVRWQAEWKPLMARIGLGADASPATANEYIGDILTLFQRLNTADDFRRRIKGIERDIADFREAVLELMREVAPELADRPAEDIAHVLHERLGQARAALKERDGLKQQLGREQDRLRDAQTRGADARIRLQALCKEAGCDQAEQLPAVEERSRRMREAEKQLRLVEEQIRQFSAGATVEAFIVEAERTDPDALDSEMARLEQRLSELRGETSNLDQTIGSERNELDRMDGNGLAAEANERAESLLAQMQTEVPRYAALHLASTLLKRAVDRYREKNQGPVLERANRIFASLTAGSFSGLKIDYDDQERLVLFGVRPNETLVGVEGMSDGSCDQLYLALRLATLEVWLENHEPVPFIVDDILLNFDDERSLAALRALVELSRKTQVIFFTHHHHLLDLARKHLDKKGVFLHRLPERSGSKKEELLFN